MSDCLGPCVSLEAENALLAMFGHWRQLEVVTSQYELHSAKGKSALPDNTGYFL